MITTTSSVAASWASPADAGLAAERCAHGKRSALTPITAPLPAVGLRDPHHPAGAGTQKAPKARIPRTRHPKPPRTRNIQQVVLGLLPRRAGGHAGVAAGVRRGSLGDAQHGAVGRDGGGSSRQRVAVLQPGDLRLGVACVGWKVGFGLGAKVFPCAHAAWMGSLRWEAGTPAQIQTYHNLDRDFRDCWMSQQEKKKRKTVLSRR